MANRQKERLIPIRYVLAAVDRLKVILKNQKKGTESVHGNPEEKIYINKNKLKYIFIYTS